MRELGRDAHGAPRVGLLSPQSGHAHAAFAEAEVEQLVDVRLVLEQDVAPDDADVGRRALDIYGDVRRLGPEIAHSVFIVREYEAPVLLQQGGAAVSQAAEQRIDLLAEPPLRQRDADILVHHASSCITSVSRQGSGASTATVLPSALSFFAAARAARALPFETMSTSARYSRPVPGFSSMSA